VNGVQSLSSLDESILRRAQREDAGDEDAAQQQPEEASVLQDGGDGDAGSKGRVPNQKQEGEDATEGAGEKEEGGGRRGRRKNRVAPEEKEGEDAAAHEGGPIDGPEAQRDQAAPSAKGSDTEAPWNREEAVKEALANRERNEPRVPNKELDGYSGLSGGKFPLTVPGFSTERPNLGDFGVGVCLYFETLRVFSLVFFAMFLLGIPSLVLTFAANPDAVSSRERKSEREPESERVGEK
jgi:hypothetical protein